MSTPQRLGIGLAIGALFMGGVAYYFASRPVAPQRAEPDEAVASAPAIDAKNAHWIVAGGGATPESNEASIEADLRLATRVFKGEGVTLFASGPESQAVRVSADDLSTDPLLAELGGIFNPRPGRTSRYRPAEIAADGGASPAALLNAVRAAASSEGDPLTVYIAGHGGPGDTRDSASIMLWGNQTVLPTDLAEAVRAAKRPTRFVITTCFSGGFAELAFKNATPADGPTDLVCGMFASTWDREAGGCDPNPDRGLHDGYGVHFLSALDGKRRDGTVIAADVLDIDGDGATSLLDAHTFAQLSSKSIDVPTTTSERWLREHAPTARTAAPLALAHEDAVIGVLGKWLGGSSETELVAKLAALDAQVEAAVAAETAAVESETDAYWDVAAALLAKWPVLDDPWHPLWGETIAAHRNAISAFLSDSAEVKALNAATEATNIASGKRGQLEVTRAPVHRVVRAYETKRLAGELQAVGGDAWTQYVALRECENSTL